MSSVSKSSEGSQPSVNAKGVNEDGGAQGAPDAARTPSSEDLELRTLCAKVAQAAGACFKIVETVRGPEAKIGLGLDGNDKLVRCAVRAWFVPSKNEVVVRTRLHEEQVKQWGSNVRKPNSSSYMKSELRLPWPLEAAHFNSLLFAAIKERQASDPQQNRSA